MFSKESVHLSAEIKHTKESHYPYLLAVPARGVHTNAKARMRTIDKVGPFALVQPGNGKRQTDLPLSATSASATSTLSSLLYLHKAWEI